MPRIDWLRFGILLVAIVAATITLASDRLVFIDVSIAQTLIGTFSVLAGFLVSALAFIRPVQPVTTLDKAVNGELTKRTIRLSAYFYLYLLNVLLLLAFTILRDHQNVVFPVLGKIALAVALFSVVLSLEVPRLIMKLRAFQK